VRTQTTNGTQRRCSAPSLPPSTMAALVARTARPLAAARRTMGVSSPASVVNILGPQSHNRTRASPTTVRATPRPRPPPPRPGPRNRTETPHHGTKDRAGRTPQGTRGGILDPTAQRHAARTERRERLWALLSGMHSASERGRDNGQQLQPPLTRAALCGPRRSAPGRTQRRTAHMPKPVR
jgi:hypothetical protein